MISKKAREYIQGKLILSSGPRVLNIEATNACNLRCSICPPKAKSQKGFLDINFLEKILKENRDVLKQQRVWLHFSGESLLHPGLPEIIKMLKANKIETMLSTNAMLLTKDLSFKLMDAGLDYIVFSVDGFSKDVYEKIRVGANFERVEENILSFLKIKKDNGSKTKTQIQFIKLKENIGEVEKFIKKWRKTDIEYINVKSFCARAGRVEKIEQFVSKEAIFKKNKNRPPCFYLWETLVILWNGDVVVCCQDLKGELKVGNLKEQTLLEIWNSPKMVDLRERQFSGDFSMIPCSLCPDWKGHPRNYFSYFCKNVYNFIVEKLGRRILKDEGINIIINKTGGVA